MVIAWVSTLHLPIPLSDASRKASSMSDAESRRAVAR
jgi:hypothetical protein